MNASAFRDIWIDIAGWLILLENSFCLNYIF